MIALVDYGAGNLTSVRKGLDAAGARHWTPTEPADLARADGIVVPGVGHFGATARLEGPWRTAIVRSIEAGTPLLGICLGMQWLFEGSEEAPQVAGLGLIPGRCFRLRGGVDASGQRAKVPHVGWNTVAPAGDGRLVLPPGSHVYFTHSYAAPVTAETTAACQHGGERFAAMVETGLIFGVQFHPEKSGDPGLGVLAGFVRVAGGSGHEDGGSCSRSA